MFSFKNKSTYICDAVNLWIFLCSILSSIYEKPTFQHWWKPCVGGSVQVYEVFPLPYVDLFGFQVYTLYVMLTLSNMMC